METVLVLVSSAVLKRGANRLIWTSYDTGWYDSVYDEELGSQPCIFTSVTPVSGEFWRSCGETEMYSCQAWNNINLTRLAEKIKSPLVLWVERLLWFRLALTFE